MLDGNGRYSARFSPEFEDSGRDGASFEKSTKARCDEMRPSSSKVITSMAFIPIFASPSVTMMSRTHAAWPAHTNGSEPTRKLDIVGRPAALVVERADLVATVLHRRADRILHGCVGREAVEPRLAVAGGERLRIAVDRVENLAGRVGHGRHSTHLSVGSSARGRARTSRRVHRRRCLGADRAAVGHPDGDPSPWRAGAADPDRCSSRSARSSTCGPSAARTYEQRDRSFAMFSPVALVVLPGVWVALVIVGLHRDPLGARGRSAPRGLLPVGLVVAHARLRTGAVVRYACGCVRRGDPWTRADRAAHQLPPVDLQRVPAARAAGRPTRLARRRTAERGGDDPSAPCARPGWTRSTTCGTTGRPGSPTSRKRTHRSRRSSSSGRSATPGSWVTAAGVVLDTAALRCSMLRMPANAQAQLCIRAGYLALRGSPTTSRSRTTTIRVPDDPISIDRSEFDAVYEELASFGVPVRPDREACWRDFRGWRVNYDTVLLALAGLTIAPVLAVDQRPIAAVPATAAEARTDVISVQSVNAAVGFCDTPSGIDSLIRYNRLRCSATAAGSSGGNPNPE